MISRMGMSAASAVAMHTAVSGKSRFIVLLGKPEACPTLLTCLARPDPFGLSLAHNFNNDAFWAPAVEFGVINLLPRAEIELSIDVRQQAIFGVVHPNTRRDVHGGD